MIETSFIQAIYKHVYEEIVDFVIIFIKCVCVNEMLERNNIKS